MARRRRTLATFAALALLALTTSTTTTTGAAAARVLRGNSESSNDPSSSATPPLPLHSSYGSYHGVAPDLGPTGNLMQGPSVTPGRGANGSGSSNTNKGNTGSPPVRGALARIQGSYAQAEARRDASGFEGIEPENVVMSTAGSVRMTRVQTDDLNLVGSRYVGTPQANTVGGRMAAFAATQNGARAQAVSGGRPIVSRYGATPQTASIRMMSGFALPAKVPVAVAGSGRVHVASFSGAADATGVIASTPLAQSISKSG
jgi:hypothetical protein